jgi:hypothetical protein
VSFQPVLKGHELNRIAQVCVGMLLWTVLQQVLYLQNYSLDTRFFMLVPIPKNAWHVLKG